MNETILVGLIAGLFGAIAAGLPAYFSQRNSPSRKVSDTASIVDSTGKVVTMYRTEIDRLDAELQETRLEIGALKDELLKRPTRDELLDANGKLRAQLISLGETPSNGMRAV